MTNKDKNIVWNVLNKYDGTLTSLCDSLSNALQGKSEKSDYVNILKHYRMLETNDMNLLDSVFNTQILKAVN
jgi:hypothetical protein